MLPVITALLITAGALAGTAAAQSFAEATRTDHPAVQTVLKSEEVIGAETVKRAYINFGTNEFAFVVPAGFRLDALTSGKIALVKEDYTCSISLVFKDAPAATSPSLRADTLRQTLLDRFPGAKIEEEFSRSAANHSGPAFDLHVPNGAGGVQYARVVCIPFNAGIIEFTLLASTNQISTSQYAFDSILLTFCSNEEGELVVRSLSTES